MRVANFLTPEQQEEVAIVDEFEAVNTYIMSIHTLTLEKSGLLSTSEPLNLYIAQSETVGLDTKYSDNMQYSERILSALNTIAQRNPDLARHYAINLSEAIKSKVTDMHNRLADSLFLNDEDMTRALFDIKNLSEALHDTYNVANPYQEDDLNTALTILSEQGHSNFSGMNFITNLPGDTMGVEISKDTFEAEFRIFTNEEGVLEPTSKAELSAEYPGYAIAIAGPPVGVRDGGTDNELAWPVVDNGRVIDGLGKRESFHRAP